MVSLPGVNAPMQGPGRTQAPARPRPGTRFTDALRDADSADAESAASDVGTVAGPAPVFLPVHAAPERADADAERDRSARRDAEAVLEDLGELQRGLLTGRLDRGALEALAQRLGRSMQAADPALAALVGEVQLRARVELARLECHGQILPDSKKCP